MTPRFESAGRPSGPTAHRTMRRNTNRGRKGGPMDDVARNIRNEQNRDAMPSPSEAKAEHRKHLRETGCKYCDEDDPDSLTSHGGEVSHSCRDVQDQRREPEVMCEEGHGTARERFEGTQQAKANEEGKPVVVYECDVVKVADEDPRRAEFEARSGPRQHHTRPWNSLTPRAPLTCQGRRCQSRIARVFWPGETYEPETGDELPVDGHRAGGDQ